ncbi:hypothetical protein [Phormidium nigroviride]
MNHTKNLVFQLSPEDSASLAAESERRQIDTITLAQILLHDTLTKLNPPPSPIAQNPIEALEKVYSFRGKTEVLQFLEEYPFLVPVLLEGSDKIRHYFPNEKLEIEVHTDPEIIEDVQLFLSIITDDNTDDDIDKALDQEEHLSKDWYLPLPYEVKKVFGFGVE